MKVSVGRGLFFDGPDGRTLRFGENAPPVDECEHSVCNCTKNVTVRPEGEPAQVQQSIELSDDLGSGMKVEMHFRPGEDCVNVIFRWPLKRSSVLDPGRKDNHAYFRFWKDNLHVEITGTGEGNVDCSWAEVHFGNEVDTSRFLNGHAASRPDHGGVDLNNINPDDVWVHHCFWGQEAYEVFPKNYATKLAGMHTVAMTLIAYVRVFNVLDKPVDEIRRGVMDQPCIADTFEQLLINLMPFVPEDTYRFTPLAYHARCVTLRSEAAYALKRGREKTDG